MNHLLELLTPANVIFNLKASSKEEVINRLLDHALQSGLIKDSEKEEIFQALVARENSMSTGIGSGVAIPHCSVESVSALKCVIGISPEGIPFDSIDNLPVHIFVMLVVPKDQFQEHIKTLALIAKTLNLEEERKKIISAKSFEEIQSAFSNRKGS